MGTDAVGEYAKSFVMGTSFYVMLDVDSDAEAQRLFDGLGTHGKVEMALQQTPRADRYGCLADRFGVRWMVNYTGNTQFNSKNT